MEFIKLHGIGNDFLVVGPGEIRDPASAGELARRVCDRHTGVGADGLIVLSREAGPTGGFGFRIFNADGSEAEISGNGLRCAAAFLASTGLADSPKVLFRTVVGDRPSEVISSRGRLFEVRISLGTPRLASKEIPFDDGRTYDRVVDYPLSVIRQNHPVTCVSIGNPHCSVFLDAFPSRGEWQGLGAEIESHPFFPHRTNVEFVRVRSRDEIEVLFWERGVGETLASGTGSAAAAVASMLKGLTGRAITVRTAIGSLKLEWPEGGEVFQTGPAEVVFTGDYPID
jgi:diaminopimelate epimerase